MSTMVTEISQRVVEVDPSGTLIANFSIVLIVLLIILLLQKEALRSLDGPRAKQWLSTLDVAIVPLMIAFAMLVFLRMATLIRFA